MKDETHLMSQPKGDDTWMARTGGFARDKTLRDHYALLAMQGLMDAAMPMPEIAAAAYDMADAMLKARETK